MLQIFCAAVLVYSERLDSTGYFKPDHLGYTTTRIFEDT